MAERDMLVWQKNPGDPVIHVDETCRSPSTRSAVPGRNVRFGGRGTAGWLPEKRGDEDRQLQKVSTLLVTLASPRRTSSAPRTR
jgi:hypothetical protein